MRKTMHPTHTVPASQYFRNCCFWLLMSPYAARPDTMLQLTDLSDSIPMASW